MLAAAMPQEQKQMLGERLFPLIHRINQELAGKITGMLLEMDNSELLMMLENAELLKSKVFLFFLCLLFLMKFFCFFLFFCFCFFITFQNLGRRSGCRVASSSRRQK